MNFTKLNSIFQHTNEIISFDELISIVSEGSSNADHIDYIRTIEYKSKEYNYIKRNLECITPHGTFSGLGADSIIESSGFLFFDIDGFESDDDIKSVKAKLTDQWPISFLCRSVGGKGISFLIKLNETTRISLEPLLCSSDTFNVVHNYIRSLLVNDGFNIDMSAGGLGRKMILSTGDLYTNTKNDLSLSIEQLNEINDLSRSNDQKGESKGSIRSIEPFSVKNDLSRSNDQRRESKGSIRSIEPFSMKDIELIRKEDLKLIEKTQIEFGDREWFIEPIDYYDIYIPEMINDGDKHTTYTRLMNAICYLNPQITIHQFYSYIYWINKDRAEEPMDYIYLRKFTFNMFRVIMKNGVRIKLRKKKIHLKDTRFGNIRGGKINSLLMVSDSINKMEEARNICVEKNIKPTQKRIAEISGLSLSTVKRHWRKKPIDLETEIDRINSEYLKDDDLTKSEEILLERENKLNSLLPGESEEDFFEQEDKETKDDDIWENWNPEKRYKVDEIIDADYGESGGIDGLIESFE